MATENGHGQPKEPGLSPTGITVLPERQASPSQIKKCLEMLAGSSSPEVSKVYGEILTKLQS